MVVIPLDAIIIIPAGRCRVKSCLMPSKSAFLGSSATQHPRGQTPRRSRFCVTASRSASARAEPTSLCPASMRRLVIDLCFENRLNLGELHFALTPLPAGETIRFALGKTGGFIEPVGCFVMGM